MRDQIIRAAISINSNFAEGFERNGTGEFIQFLSIAKGPAGELRAQLYSALDQYYIKAETVHKLLASITEISRMLGGLIEYLQKTELKGTKYKKHKTNLKL